MSGEITTLLESWSQGGVEAEEALFREVFGELRSLACHHLRQERAHHTLQPTELVHELFLRLSQDGQGDWKNRRHFFGACSRIIRRVLIDHGRKYRAAKRGGGEEAVSLDLVGEPAVGSVENTAAMAIGQALEKLALVRERAAQVVELRYFLGLTFEEVGLALGCTERTARSDWVHAKAWLYREMMA